MKQVARYRWIVDSETPPGRRTKTQHHMTVDEAHPRHTNAVPIENTRQWLDMSETAEEIEKRRMQRKPSPVAGKPPLTG